MKKLFKPLLFLLIIGLLIGGWAAYMAYSSAYDAPHEACIYVDADDDVDSVKTKLTEAGVSTSGMALLGKVMSFRTRTGRYVIPSGISSLALFRKLRSGDQDAVKMTVPSVRSIDKVAGAISHNIMLDSLTILQAFEDEARLTALGYDKQTLPALFIPNTYEVFWDISIDKLLERLSKEYTTFWNADRTSKAKAQGLTPLQASTLASIVDEETANNAEKATIAGLYLNRLHKDMLLQADPTVKAAVGDWSIKRVLNKHLETDSPYNTYRYRGLPPGPIRIPSIAGLEAVLSPVQHDYIYMCAKEDFSGTHNFAVTLAEHQANARKYINALNQRGIK